MDKLDGIPLAHRFQEELQAVIDKYTDEGLCVGEAVGAIELIKLDIVHSHREDDDEVEFYG